MNASARKAQQIITVRRRANRKCSLSTLVAKVAMDEKSAKTVTGRLRSSAKVLREAGQLGKVQTRVCHVAPGRVGPNYRYNAAQRAAIVAHAAAGYRPRNAENKATMAALIAA